MARDATLERYLAIIRSMQNYFKGFTIEYIERAKNTEADELANAAAKKAALWRPLRKNSQARAQNGKHQTGKRLACTNHGRPSPSLQTRQEHREAQMQQRAKAY
jgi:hypothetical protein